MKHRIFIAVNLPEDTKNRLGEYQQKWLDLPVRWTKKENIHITLIFLGYLSDEELLEVIEATRETAARTPAFSINFSKICYGPPKKMPPRMVWVEGEKSEELGKLQSDLENSLLSFSVKGLEREKRAYSPHITLGRVKTWEWRQMETEERPEVNEEISLTFGVNSIEVMESQLRRGGPNYTVLETCPLKS